MQEYNTIIGKLLTGINRRKFKRFVDKYNGDYGAKKLTCWEQFVAVFLGQVSELESLREIVDSIKYHSNQQYHLGIKKDIARSTLALANEKRDWKIYRDLCFDLIKNRKILNVKDNQEVVKLIDSSPIYLNLNLHKWAEETQRIKGIKFHVVYNLSEEMPVYFDFSGAKTNDIEKAKTLELKTNTTYVFDRGYMDFNWWKEIDDKGSYFVTRLKKNNAYQILSEKQITDERISSKIICLTNKSTNGRITKNRYKGKPLKVVEVSRKEEGKSPLILVTNDFKRSDNEIAELYKQRWQIELFFKWIKQNLKIKKFLGRSENAIKTQICIAIIVFVLLRMTEELKEICMTISPKNLLKIIGNNLFSCLKVREFKGKQKYKNPNQLQFQWALAP